MLNRRSHSEAKKEYTTEQIRLELAEKEAILKSANQLAKIENNNDKEAAQYQNSDLSTTTTTTKSCPDKEMIDVITVNDEQQIAQKVDHENSPCDENSTNTENIEISANDNNQKSNTKDYDNNLNADEQLTNIKEPSETKSKKKRRKKFSMKKKASLTTSQSMQMTSASTNANSTSNTSRKSSSSSSVGSVSAMPSEQNDIDINSNVCKNLLTFPFDSKRNSNSNCFFFLFHSLELIQIINPQTQHPYRLMT